MAIKKLIKRFRFTRDQRARLDLTGGLRLNPDSHSIEVPDVGVQGGASPLAPVYSTATDLTFRTWLVNPEAIKSFVSMSSDLVAPKLTAQDAPAPLYGVQFRLSNGAQEFYHDGAAWTVATLAGHWNLPGDFATNLPSFPVSQLDPDLGFAIAVNMWSNDARVTPKLRALKVLYEADVNEGHDLLYNSLVPELESLDVRGRLLHEMTADSNTLDLSDLEALGVDTFYDISGVVAAYNYTQDARRLTDIVASFDPNSKLLTLSEVVPEGEHLWVDFSWRPIVAVQTSSEFYEFARVPRIDVTQFQELDHKVDSTYIEDAVLHPVTGAGWKIVGPRVSNVAVQLDLIADKQYDLMHMREAFMAWVIKTSTIRMRGIDEEFLLEIAGGPTYSTQATHNDISTDSVSLLISDVTFYNSPAIEAQAILSVKFTNGNVTLAIS